MNSLDHVKGHEGVEGHDWILNSLDSSRQAALANRTPSKAPSPQPPARQRKSFYFLLCYFSFLFVGNNGKLHHFSFNISH